MLAPGVAASKRGNPACLSGESDAGRGAMRGCRVHHADGRAVSVRTAGYDRGLQDETRGSSLPIESTPVIAATPSPSPRMPGIWSGLGIVVLYFVLQLAVAVLLGAIAIFGYGVAMGMQGRKASTGAIMQWIQSPDIKTGFTVATMTVVAALMLWFVRRLWRGQWKLADPPGFGFVRPRRGIWFLYAVVAGIAAVVLGGLMAQLLAGEHPVKQDVAVMGQQVSLGMRVLLALLVVCVAPLVEELIFRGVLLSGLMRRMKTGWAVAISALVFGCVHLPDFKFAWYAIPTLVLLGVVLAWLRLHSRSLWPAVTAHAANNLVAVIGWFAVLH